MHGEISTVRKGTKKNGYRILVRETIRKDPLQGPRLKCDDSMKLCLKDKVWQGLDWIQLAEDRYMGQDLVNTIINFSCSIKCKEFLIQLRS
jgi:hypothetical protein